MVAYIGRNDQKIRRLTGTLQFNIESFCRIFTGTRSTPRMSVY